MSTADHKAAKEWAVVLRYKAPDSEDRNLAACYLERDAEVVELRQQLSEWQSASDSCASPETLRTVIAAYRRDLTAERKVRERVSADTRRGLHEAFKDWLDDPIWADAMLAENERLAKSIRGKIRENAAAAQDGPIGANGMRRSADEATRTKLPFIIENGHSAPAAAPVWTDEMLAENERLAETIRGKIVAAHTDHPLQHWDRTCPACNPPAAAQFPCGGDLDAILEFSETGVDPTAPAAPPAMGVQEMAEFYNSTSLGAEIDRLRAALRYCHDVMQPIVRWPEAPVGEFEAWVDSLAKHQLAVMRGPRVG